MFFQHSLELWFVMYLPHVGGKVDEPYANCTQTVRKHLVRKCVPSSRPCSVTPMTFCGKDFFFFNSLLVQYHSYITRHQC